MIVVNSSTRQFNIPGADLVFGVTADSGAVTKEFQCPRYIGNNLDLAGCFIRMNYRNANGEIDSYLVKNVTVDGDNVVFGWELSPKVTMYKGNVSFVMCVTGPDTKVAWHTTLGRGQVLEGLEPDWESVMDETVDVVAQLVAMVEAQTEAVADTGAEWVRIVQSEGTDQIVAVQTAGRESREAAVAEIEAKGVNVRESIPEDYTSLENTVDGLVRGRAGAIVCSVEGSAVVVNDASDLPMQGMKIFGRSTQDGTPTPDAPVEIKSVVEPVVTVCGKNLLNMDALIDDNFVKNPDGSYTLTKTGVGDLRFSAKADLKLPVGVYTLSVGALSGTDTAARFVFTHVDNHEVSHSVTPTTPKIVTVENAVKKVSLYISTSLPDGTYVTMSDVMLEVGSKATAYEPYKAFQTVELTHTLPGIPVTSSGNYTDSDGQQWICDEVDLERGVYVSRTKRFDLGGLKTNTWYTWGVNHSAPGATGFYHYFDDEITNAFVLSNIGEHSAKAWGGVGIGVGIGTSTDGDYFIVSVPNEVLADTSTNTKAVESFLAFIAETKAVILAAVAPIETTLSETEIAAYRALHSNYPNTTVLNDSGAHMVVKYAADTKLYIDNKIAALVGG